MVETPTVATTTVETTRTTRRDLVTFLVLFVVLCGVYGATVNQGPAQVNDTRAASIASWSLGTQGSAALPSTWPPNTTYWGVEGRDGAVFVNRFPGVAYWAAPAYALADLVDGDPPPAHPYLVDLAPAALTAAVTAALAVAVVFLLLRTVAPWPAALGSTVVFAVGTSMWSVAADALWPHGPGVLALAGMLLSWRRERPVLAAVCAAVAMLVRPHLVVAVGIVALYAFWRERRRDGVAMALGAGVGLGLVAAYSYWAFGTPLPIAGYNAGSHLDGLVVNSTWQTASQLGLAFGAPTRGLLTLSPVIVPALVAVVVFRRRVPGWTLAGVVAGLLYLFVQVRAVGHRGGNDFFAYRVSLEPLLFWLPALAVAAHEAIRRSRTFATVLTLTAVVSVGIHWYGAVNGAFRDDVVEKWDRLDADVQREFANRRLGDVDLRKN
ncbi:hypothetical protein [Egicoccus sp. AB-alg2]|uniref:hypothetical protein n=1 Tax=Egicoccus sp. AB-alg2 TaxID=3242693 RepID=UPI00359D289D